ncbi:MAG: Gfo/Idh/MocA family oxidoreductase, partial [Thermoplasmata archaeon]|nr:Gfo/Idh/MocA family oxidoreductase [Thermoplasmata archaeon]
EAHRARFGFARAYGDGDAMVAAESPDAVAVVVPESVTVAVAVPLLERGIPLLLEKPPGRTVEEIDRLIAAADHGGRLVPHQVALNRRYAPVVADLRRRLARVGPPEAIHHIHYEMTRFDRRDPDFSVTAIHGIDAVRFIAASDYAHVRFRYQERSELGPGVANVFMDAVMVSGATAHLAFCPVAGVVVERATVHAAGQTLFVHVPMWGAFDSPGRLQQLEAGALVSETIGTGVGGGAEPWELGGFFAEYEAFLGALVAGRTPSPSLRESRQSVAVAEVIRRRRDEFKV